MRIFSDHGELQRALDDGSFRFLPTFGPASFICCKCKKACPLNTDGGGGTGYARASRESTDLICYPCADESQRVDMLDRSRPFGCYLSGDGRRVTTWTGGTLGDVVQSGTSRTGWHGTKITHVRVRDVHGAMWHGKGAGAGMCITLRPMKGGRA